MSLAERLDKIRSPKLQNQRETAIVLSAVEDTLKDQNHGFTPTAYFAALLALLGQSLSPSKEVVNKELATSVVYLLDLVTPHVPTPLLRSKFAQILTNLAPALSGQDVEAPLIRSSIGCLESLLVVQDPSAWALSPAQVGPRRATAGLLNLAVDHRPKVRKRAQDALTKILQNPPPSPSLDHPAADMCAESVLRGLSDIANAAGKSKKNRSNAREEQSIPGLMHAIQLAKTIAAASGGWPSKKMEPLCEILRNISRSSSEYLAMASFEVFEIIFNRMTDQSSSSKLLWLLDVISELRPSQNESQLLPPWIAVISRGFDILAQVDSETAFHRLPGLFDTMSEFLASPAHSIRLSASEGVISLIANGIPNSVIFGSSIYDDKILEKLCGKATALLSIKYQAAWMEIFKLLSALFESLKWRSALLLSDVVTIVGELRGNDSFNGKQEADHVLGKAIQAMGPEAVLNIIPLNLAKPKIGQTGRAWLLPILRDNVVNTNLAHFRSEFVPLSEEMFQRVIDSGDIEKTMEIKIFETLVQQIWALLPGYCSLPLDLPKSFDQEFAELAANLLYQRTDLRPDICKALQVLVDSNRELAYSPKNDQNDILQSRLTSTDAKRNISHLANFAGNLLSVLFNVYSQTLPQYRGYILQCINSYLSITPEKELLETFARVTSMLESSLNKLDPQTQADKQKKKASINTMPPTSHSLMDLVITMSVYIPRSSFSILFSLAALILPQMTDPQLQKKAYKLIPRLSKSSAGRIALADRNHELQHLMLTNATSASISCRRDRLFAISIVVENLPPESLHFIPSVLSEVVISAKEVNEKARTAAFDLLVLMADRMSAGGSITQSRIPHMPAEAPVAEASLEEFFTMVSAGLAGSTPHMISASVIALTRILYEFRTQLKESAIEDLVQTMDLFLTSTNREIVQSVLGFVKVAVISLPEETIKPRLQTVVPGLMGWSKEHKAHFRSRIKHIFERMIRRFGVENVERWCPESDRKLIANIRKTRERRKRKKMDDNEDEAGPRKQKSKFESEYDEAIYGSEEDVNSEMASVDSESDLGRSRSRKGSQTFIVEDDEEPLNLLDRKALGNISSTKPVRLRQRPMANKKLNAKTDLDGKLVLGDDDDSDGDDNDAVMLDLDANTKDPGDGTLEGGIDAYVDAIKGQDAVQRRRGGRLKFSNKRGKDEMEIHEEMVKKGVSNGYGGISKKKKMMKLHSGRMGQRKGLGGVDKVSGGRKRGGALRGGKL